MSDKETNVPRLSSISFEISNAVEMVKVLKANPGATVTRLNSLPGTDVWRLTLPPQD